MANITVSSTFAGIEATPIISAALFQGKTLANKWIKIMPDVRYKAVIQKFDSTNLLQAYSNTFSDSGTFTKAEAVLQVTDIMVNKSFPKKQLESDWRSTNYTGGATDSIDNGFVDYVTNYIAAKASEQNELILWRGNFTGATAVLTAHTLYTGLYRQIDTGSPNRVTATAITKSNVIECLDAVYEKALTSCAQILDQKPCFYVSLKTGGLFAQRQTVNDTSRGAITSAGSMQYLGYEVRVCPGCFDDQIVFCNPDSLVFGTLVAGEENNVTVIDMLTSTLDLDIRMRIDLKAGTQISYGGEIVYFK